MRRIERIDSPVEESFWREQKTMVFLFGGEGAYYAPKPIRSIRRIRVNPSS